MPAGPSHIYFFLDPMDRSVYWEMGLLGFSATPRPLVYTPNGWKEISIIDQRNIPTWTLDVDFTIPLDFVMDGAQILKTWFSTRGTEDPLFMAIMEQKIFYDGANYYYYYTLLYKSQVDFSSYKHTGPSVSVNMLDQGFAMQLKNNAAKTFQYNLADSHLLAPIYFDGIELTEKGNFQVIDGVDFSDAAIDRFAVPFAFLNAEGTSAGVQFKLQEFESYANEATYITTSGNWCAKAEETNPGPITLHGLGQFQFKCTRNDADEGQFFLQFRGSLGQKLDLHFTPNEVLVVGRTYTFAINLPITLAPGEALFLTGFITSTTLGAITHSVSFLPESKMSFQFTNRFVPTFVKAFDIFEVFSMLITSLTGRRFVAAPSNMLSKVGLKIAITSGDGIRGIAGAILKLTWNNFWSLVNMYEDPAIYVIGNQVFMERKEDAADFLSIIDLGQVSGFSSSIANSLKFNLMKIGSPNQDYGATNGKDEFNTTLEMGAPVSSVSTEVDFISDIRIDGFGAEFERTGLDGKDTTDSTADGAPFAFHIEDSPVIKTIGTITQPAFRFNRDLNPFCTGVLSPSSVINLALSPKQCLYRKGNYLLSILNMLEGKQLTFQTLDKNQLLQVNKPGSRPVIENANENIGDLGTPYFKPVFYDFTAMNSTDIIQVRKRNPRAVIRFSVDDITYTCLPIKEGVQPATDAAQAYQMLAGADNDLTLLNNYYGD